jgi:hypothetical protein
MARDDTPHETWNIAEVEIVEGTRASGERFVRLAGFWISAFLVVVAASIVGLGVAEAAPVGRLSAVPGPAMTTLLAGVVGSAGGLLVLLLRRAGRAS